jgi:uncharacterized repeat protein (TIGR01451 family)
MGSAIPDPTGAFTMALKPGNYLVSASAFGYVSDTARVAIAADEAAQVNLRLPPRTSDAGYFVGAVTDIDGEPLDGRVVLVDTPVEEPFTGGQFAIAGIPPGDYTARIESKGHRVESRQIGIRAGEATRETFQLAGAPTILVVDGDAWHFSGALSYYTSSLDRLGYVYDSWRVLDRELPKLPTVDQMAAYDLVIWTQDFSSPGYLKAGYLLAGYLDKGGRLLLAGQDVACTDSGHAPCAEAWMRQPYLTDRFYADLVDDVATSKAVRGLVGTPLEGIDVTLNGDESLNNQWAPDVVEATNPLHAAISAEYGSGEGAAVFAATCTGYRALLLGFGLEGVNGASSRDRLLGAAIDGLWLPLPPALILEPGADRLIQAAGAAASYTLTLHNTAEVAVPVTVTLSGNGWPTELFKAGFAAPLGERVDAGACEPVEIGVRVTVPSDARRGESDTVTIDARAPAGLPSARTALVTQAPATVLVVDGDMWIPSQETYEGALEAMGVPFDRHVVAPDPSRPSSGGPPTPSTLSLYPIVVWFTGFNPHPSGHLDVPTMQMLAGYLGNGGRLLFASEDHLNFRGATPFEDDRLFQREYLGVDAYYQDVGITALQGAPDTPYADIGPCALRPSGDAIADYFADQLFPGPRAEGILTSSAGRIAATRYFSGTAKTVFMAFDPSKLDGKCAEPAIDRSIDWFSRLTESDLVADRTSYASGDTVHLSLQLIGDGPKDTEDVTVRWVLPNAGVPVRLPGAPWRYDPAIRTILWSGSVLRGHPVHVEADVVLDADLPEGLGQSSDVEIYDGDGITLRRTAAWRVNVADLTASDKTVNRPGPVDRGDIVRFTISVRNRGSLPVPTFTVTDTLPDGLELLERSITRPAGELVDVTPHRVVWRSSVDAGGQASLSYDARITTLAGGYLENIARVDDGSGAPMTLSARVLVRPNLLFPWVGQSAQLPRR